MKIPQRLVAIDGTCWFDVVGGPIIHRRGPAGTIDITTAEGFAIMPRLDGLFDVDDLEEGRHWVARDASGKHVKNE